MSKTIIVTTGYGYFTKDGNITDRATLPSGVHPMKDGYSYVEVDTKEIYDEIEIYKPILTDLQLKEDLIINKAIELSRSNAIEALKTDGKLSVDGDLIKEK